MQVLLIVEYSYLTAARCLCISDDTSTGGSDGGSSGGCVWVLPTDPAATRHALDVLGLHSNSAAVLPLFLIYLATLMYNYVLGSSQLVTYTHSMYNSSGSSSRDQAGGPENTAGTAVVRREEGEATTAAEVADSVAASQLHSALPSAPAGPVGGRGGRGDVGPALQLVLALQGWARWLWLWARLQLCRAACHLK